MCGPGHDRYSHAPRPCGLSRRRPRHRPGDLARSAAQPVAARLVRADDRRAAVYERRRSRVRGTDRVRGTPLGEVLTMVTHVVLMKPRADLSADERRAFVAAFERATREIPSVVAVRVGRRVK